MRLTTELTSAREVNSDASLRMLTDHDTIMAWRIDTRHFFSDKFIPV